VSHQFDFFDRTFDRTFDHISQGQIIRALMAAAASSSASEHVSCADASASASTPICKLFNTPWSCLVQSCLHATWHTGTKDNTLLLLLLLQAR
jgi:hypothetical protein